MTDEDVKEMQIPTLKGFSNWRGHTMNYQHSCQGTLGVWADGGRGSRGKPSWKGWHKLPHDAGPLTVLGDDGSTPNGENGSPLVCILWRAC